MQIDVGDRTRGKLFSNKTIVKITMSSGVPATKWSSWSSWLASIYEVPGWRDTDPVGWRKDDGLGGHSYPELMC